MNKIILDMLTENSVSVVTKKYAEIDGITYLISTSRKAYSNSPIGRQQISDELSESDSAAVFAKWGNTATIEDPPELAQAEGEGE